MSLEVSFTSKLERFILGGLGCLFGRSWGFWGDLRGLGGSLMTKMMGLIVQLTARRVVTPRVIEHLQKERWEVEGNCAVDSTACHPMEGEGGKLCS